MTYRRQLGGDFDCSYNVERPEFGDKFRIKMQDGPQLGRPDLLAFFAERDGHTVTSVYLNETQVDDLIVTLLYWKENH